MHCPICRSLAGKAWPVDKTEDEVVVTYWISECFDCGAKFDQRCAIVDTDADEEAQALVNHDFYMPAFSDSEYEERLDINLGMIDHFARFSRDTTTFVEIGVGLGFLTRAAGARYDKAYGLDLEVDTALQTGDVPHNVHFVRHDEFLRDNSTMISALCAWHVVEHLPNPAAVLSPLFFRMKSDSIFFGQIPLYRPEYVFGAHYVFHNERSLLNLTAAYGFHPVYFERDEVNQFLSFCFRRN
jgi:hypothetical protein